MGFFGFRRKMIQYVQEQGGMYELYKHFVELFIEDGFQLREVNEDSLYVHYGTNKGKIGVQIIQGSIEKIQIIVAEELPFNRRNTFKIDTITDFPIFQVHDKILTSLKLVEYPQISFDEIESFNNKLRRKGLSERQVEYESNKKFLTWDIYLNNNSTPKEFKFAIRNFFIRDKIVPYKFYENLNYIESGFESHHFTTHSLQVIKSVHSTWPIWFVAAYPEAILWFSDQYSDINSPLYATFSKINDGNVFENGEFSISSLNIIIELIKETPGFNFECKELD